MIRFAKIPPRCPRIGRHVVVGVIGAVVAITTGIGCSRSGPRAGGATTPQAQEMRKKAELYALDAVKGAAEAEVDAHPELARKSGISRMVARLKKMNPLAHAETPVSTTVTPSPTPLPAPVPAAPVPTVRKPPPPPTTIAPPEPASAPPSSRGAKRVVIRERVASNIPHRTDAEAEDDVLRQAQDRIEQKLRELDPPVEYRPTVAVVKNEYVRKESRTVRPPTTQERDLLQATGYDPDRVYVEYTVEMTADQVRELRMQDRLGSALRVFGMITAVSLAGFLFLRIDEWSKGYLTSWLAFIAMALVGGAVAALVLV